MKITDRMGMGFVDAHVHVISIDGLDAVAAAGVVAVRDAGTKREKGLKAHKEARKAPAVLSAGRALFKRGGYGSQFGDAVETREEIKSEIVRLRQEGANIIKVIASGMVGFRAASKITPGGFHADELAFIVDEAAEQGLGVMAHANGEAAILACAAAGVRSIEHGFFMTERALSALAEKSIFWVPTVDALDRAAKRAGSPETARSLAADLIQAHLSMIGRAHSIGVPLAVGTDCTLPDPQYREAYEAEIEWFKQAGISETEVLKIASEKGKELLGLV